MTLIGSKEAFRKVPPRQKDVAFPELGGDIRFVEMTEAEWEAFDKAAPHYGLRLIIACAHGDGGRLYQDSDINKLVLWPKHMAERGARAVLTMHGLIGSDEDWEKNSGPASPTTASPPPPA